eukprot:tig00000829_g4648.t1
MCRGVFRALAIAVLVTCAAVACATPDSAASAGEIDAESVVSSSEAAFEKDADAPPPKNPAQAAATAAKPAAAELSSLKENVFQRGLVSEQVAASDILKNHKSYHENVSRRQLVGFVLAYVAPWSSVAYTRARIFRSKFTHIAPVWFQLRPREPLSMLSVELIGGDIVDKKLLKNLRGKSGGGPKVVPRLAFTDCDESFVLRLSSDYLAVERLLETLTSAIRQHGLDGFTFALYGNISHVPTAALRTSLQRLAIRLADALHKEKAELVLEVPTDSSVFGPADWKILRGIADAFVLTAVNASSPAIPGPTAPLSWARTALSSLVGEPGVHTQTTQHPLMLQLALHGFDFPIPRGTAASAWAVSGAQFVRLLEKHRPKALAWGPDAAEHSFTYTRSGYQSRRVYYPSLAALQARLRMAGELGCGVALWELGSALDYFFDLL